jgi:uncharacterized membrane protein YphA (DoxX/SURF4 family)
MNKTVDRFISHINQHWGSALGIFRIALGAALIGHGLYLAVNPWAIGNWLELRTTDLLQAVVLVALIGGGAALLAGVFSRGAALVTAPFYYWVAISALISATPEPAAHIVLNSVAFLALQFVAIAGTGRFTADELRRADRNNQQQAARATNSGT